MNADIEYLEKKAKDIRRSIIEFLAQAKSGHTAGSLDMADVFAVLYFCMMRHFPKTPLWPERDRLILSNGHICPVLYATLAHAGYFPLNELLTFRKIGSRLQGHPHRKFLRELESSSGPLGSGLSQAVGMAISDKMDGIESSGRYIYCIMSDGEFDEGATWEALMLGSREGLSNLIAIVDRNGIQLSGDTEKILPLESLAGKISSFNWNVLECDGHNIENIIAVIDKAKAQKNKPNLILAKTIASKGVPEWEGKWQWHGKVPTLEEAKEVINKYFS